MFCSRCGTEVQKEGKFCPSCGLDLNTVTTGGSAPTTQSQPAEQTEFEIVRDSLKDEYELIKELGRGGMAIVYRAKEKGLDREVAVKVLPFSLAFDKDFVERFQREARTSAKLEHPHIIPIYRVGRSDKVIYFVMKFLRGKSLSDVVKDRGALPPSQIRKLLAETAYALGYAHKHGIVHRDIKPDNIMLDELDRAIVTDFGIAKAASGTKLTGTGMSIGTPHYMSPEQARAQSLDGRSDIYSLGVVAYQCLTGRVPFDGEDSFSIGYKHIMEEIPTPELAGREQRDLFDIIRTMMAKQAAERFQDADHLARVLEGKAPVPAAPLASAPTVSMRAQPTTMAQVYATTSTTTPTTPMPRTDMRPSIGRVQQKKKRSGALVGMFFMLIAGSGAGGWYYYNNYLPQVAEGAKTDSAAAAKALADSAALRDSVQLADSIRADSSRKLATSSGPQTTTGMLLVEGLPAGGRLVVDGKPLILDANGLAEVEMGSHRIVARANGYDSVSQMVTIARGVQKALPLNMIKSTPRQTVGGPKTGASGTSNQATEQKLADAPSGTAQCETPNVPTYNLNNFCWDDRPQQISLPLVPIGDDIQGNPSASIVLVLVSEDGKVLRVSGKQVSNDPTFHVKAMTFARNLEFKPAQKNGHPIKAWAEVMLRPTRQK